MDMDSKRYWLQRVLQDDTLMAVEMLCHVDPDGPGIDEIRLTVRHLHNLIFDYALSVRSCGKDSVEERR